MKKIRIFSVMFLLLFLLTSCNSKKEENENQGNNNNEEKFLEIINTPLENYTSIFDMDLNIEIGESKEKMSQNTVYLMEINKDKAYMNITVDGEHVLSTYYEINGKDINVWANFGEGWEEENSVKPEDFEMPTMLPSQKVEKGDFELVDGVWVGDVEKINAKISDVILDSLSSMNIEDEPTFTLKEYKVTIKDNQVSKIDIEFEFEITMQGEVFFIKANYYITFTDHNNTQVTKPEEIK